jgi:hypothetical protein
MSEHTKITSSSVLGMFVALLLGPAGCLLDDTIDINRAPTANAGPDQQLAYDGTPVRVRLDGSRSKDSDGTIVKYHWLSGDRIPDAGLLGRADEVDPADSARPTIELEEGTHSFTLWVTDDRGTTSTPDSVTIRIGTDPVAECVANVLPVVSEPCRQCVCAMDDACRTAVVACDAACWSLIACVGAMCPDTTDTMCIVSNCSSFLGGATLATPAGKCVAPCASACKGGSSAADAGM